MCRGVTYEPESLDFTGFDEVTPLMFFSVTMCNLCVTFYVLGAPRGAILMCIFYLYNVPKYII